MASDRISLIFGKVVDNDGKIHVIREDGLVKECFRKIIYKDVTLHCPRGHVWTSGIGEDEDGGYIKDEFCPKCGRKFRDGGEEE